ncbi:hypothetical protein I79_014614 [Cricetulus griseus]|uniref:Uncharacterized protein n=1 Tax=Cricetulus griseus TaxID=10029 RepID=G3HUK2_CRIGR|nr:hypothetical protein I79_014614 [Cricetulus griseus]
MFEPTLATDRAILTPTSSLPHVVLHSVDHGVCRDPQQREVDTKPHPNQEPM